MGGYLLAWLVWGAAMVLVALGGFRLTRWLRPLWLRDLLRFLVLATLLAPAPAGSVDGGFAPAWIVFLFEALLQTDGDPVPAMMMLTVGWGLALCALAGAMALRFWRRRQ